MFTVDNNVFEALVTDAIQHIPEPYGSKMHDVAFFIEDEPDQDQRTRLGLRSCQSLFGLYEGVPLTHRRGGYALTLPDKITIFKKTHEYAANDINALRQQVYKTVWHEVAHYFGLNHARIHAIEKKLDS